MACFPLPKSYKLPLPSLFPSFVSYSSGQGGEGFETRKMRERKRNYEWMECEKGGRRTLIEGMGRGQRGRGGRENIQNLLL